MGSEHEKTKTWKSPSDAPAVTPLSFRKLDHSFDTSEDKNKQINGLVDEAFEDDDIDAKVTFSDDKCDAMDETQFAKSAWSKVNEELQISLANINTEKRADSVKVVEYEEKSNVVDFDEEDESEEKEDPELVIYENMGSARRSESSSPSLEAAMAAIPVSLEYRADS